MRLALPDSVIFTKTLEWDTQLSDTDILAGLDLYFADMDKPLAIDFKRLNQTQLRVMMTEQDNIQHLSHSVDSVESVSYAIKRALDKHGKLTGPVTGFYFSENNHIFLSIFEDNNLVFYHEGDTMPPLPIADIPLFFIEDKLHWLNQGLSLWTEADWNLLPWRLHQLKKRHRQGRLFCIKAVLASLLLVILAHIILITVLQDKTNTRLKTVQTQQQTAAVQLFHDLNTLVPTGVYLNDFSIDYPTVQLTGRAITPAQLEKFRKNLENNPLLNQIVLTEKPDNTQPPYRFMFNATAHYRGDLT